MANPSLAGSYPTTSDGASSSSFKDGVKNVGERAETVKDDVLGLGREVAQTAKAGAEAAKDGISRGLDTAKAKSKDVAKSAMDFVTEKPYTSVAIAAGAGLLIGMLLGRARS